MARGAFLAAAVACALSGCGTAMNVSGGCCGASSAKAVYGGVRQEAAVIGEYAQKIGKAEGPGDAAFTAAIAMCVALDLPLSAVADTLTLPITIPASLRQSARQEEKNTLPADAVWTDGGKSEPRTYDRIHGGIE